MHVRTRNQVRNTNKTEKNVRATRCSVFTPRRVHDIRYVLYAKSVNNLRMRKNLAKMAATLDLQESVAITLSTTCDLTIGDSASDCLGVRAIESLDVRVATIVARTMKRK